TARWTQVYGLARLAGGCPDRGRRADDGTTVAVPRGPWAVTSEDINDRGSGGRASRRGGSGCPDHCGNGGDRGDRGGAAGGSQDPAPTAKPEAKSQRGLRDGAERRLVGQRVVQQGA